MHPLDFWLALALLIGLVLVARLLLSAILRSLRYGRASSSVLAAGTGRCLAIPARAMAARKRLGRGAL